MPTKAELEQEVSGLKDELKKLDNNQRLEALEGIVNFIHLQGCKLNHDGECDFYLETSMEDPWEQPEHLVWIEEAERILQLSDLDPIAAEDQAIIGATFRYYRLLQIIGPKGVYFMQRLLEL